MLSQVELFWRSKTLGLILEQNYGDYRLCGIEFYLK